MLLAVFAQLVIAGAEDVAALLQPSNRLTAMASVNKDADNSNFDTSHQKRLAVIVVGLQDRAISKSKFERVIQPSLQAGWEVDVFLALVRSAAQQGEDWNPIEGFVPSPDFNSDLEAFNQTLIEAGGRLAHFETLDAPDVLIREDIGRLTLYPPHNNSVGANAIRRYYQLELAAKEVLKKENDEHIRYSFVLSTKDDDEWMGSFDISSFALDLDEDRHMYDKDCASWDGVNDKTLLFGRYAFEAVLPNIYSEFWVDEPTLVTYNSETFAKAFLDWKGVSARPVPFSRLPTLDTVYIHSNKTGHTHELELCQKDRQPTYCLDGDSDVVEHFNTTKPSEFLVELNLCA